MKPIKGRPTHEPTEETRQIVTSWASGGQTHAEICEEIGISINTLYKYYRAELDEAEPVLNEKVKGTLFKMATSGECPSATIFWCKVRLGWVEKAKLEVSTPGAGLDLSKLTTDELIQFEKLNAKASIAPANPSGD
jgi:hypothetical protein